MPSLTTQLPFIHDDDCYVLSIEEEADRVVLRRIVRYAHNQNVAGEQTSYRDLDEHTKDAILRKIGQRYPQRNLLRQC